MIRGATWIKVGCFFFLRWWRMNAWLLLTVFSIVACGARTQLDEPPEAGPSSLPCGQAANGTTVWQTALPADQTFVGPYATDASGATFYLGLDPTRYPTSYTLVAIDSCGQLTWRSAPLPTAWLNGATPDVVVAGDHVLYAWGTVDAFDRKTGAHVWNVDLDALTNDKLALDDFAELGALAVTADGSAYMPMTFGSGATIAKIDTAGNATMVVPHVQGSVGDISGSLVDAAGHLDVLFNSVDGMIVTSYTRDGAFVFSSALACNAGFLGPLASGTSFVAMQSGPCLMSFAGATLFSPPDAANGAFIAVDGADNLYVVGGYPGIASLDSSGHQRWAAATSDYIVSSPLLGSGQTLFVAQVPSSISSGSAAVSVVEYDASSGHVLATYATPVTYPKSSVPNLPLLLTTAGQLVFSWNNAAMAIAAGAVPDTSAAWPTSGGTPDRRNSAL